MFDFFFILKGVIDKIQPLNATFHLPPFHSCLKTAAAVGIKRLPVCFALANAANAS